jgi:hypothetical protein
LQGGPQKESSFCNVAPGRPAGAGCSIPASSPPGLAWEGLGEGARVTRVWFGGSDGGWSGSGERHAGGQRGVAAAAAQSDGVPAGRGNDGRGGF